jgi:phage recombination protein Bet
MSTAIQKSNQSLAVQEAVNEAKISPGELEIIKNVYAKGATNEELAVFIKTAKELGVSILRGQVHLVKRGWGDNQSMTIQIGIDGYRSAAAQTGNYRPSDIDTIYKYDAQGKLESATVYVKMKVDGEWFDVPATAFYEEYVQRKKDGEPNQMWGKMPRMMLAKCAESLALRKAFPHLSGVYTQEEMMQAENPPHIPNAAAGQTNWENPIEFSGPPQSSPAAVQQPEVQGSKPLNPVATSLTDLLTAKQIGMIKAKVKAIPALDGYGLNADDECEAVFSCKVDELSKAAADYLIKHLIAVEAGKYAPAAKPKQAQPEVIEAEIIDVEVVKEAVERKLDEHAELVAEIDSLIAGITGGDEELVKNVLGNRKLDKMSVSQLRNYRDLLRNPPDTGVNE